MLEARLGAHPDWRSTLALTGPLVFRVPCVQSLGWVWLEAACFGSGSVRTRGASSGLGVARHL